MTEIEVGAMIVFALGVLSGVSLGGQFWRVVLRSGL